MLDFTNRPKGTQRRLARKRVKDQSASAGAARSQREPAERMSLRSQPAASSAPRRLRRKLTPQRSSESIQPRPSAPRPSANQPQGIQNSGHGASSPSHERLMRQAPQPHPRLRKAQSNSSRRPGQAEAEKLSHQTGSSANSQGNGPATAGQLARPLRSHEAKRTGFRDQPRDQPRSRPTSPLVHLCRLLILGVGMGAIVGTVISVWNPGLRNPSTASRLSEPTASQQLNPNRAGSAPGTLATVSTVRIGREMTDLVAKVTPLTRDLTDLVPGVFLLDLDNGDYLSFNGSTAFSAASMIKLPILIAFLQDVDAGKIKLDEVLSLQQADVAEGSGDMQYSAAGSQFTALDTATNMIIHSDNTATNMIVRRLGGNEILNQRFRQWGLQQTLLRQPLPDLEGLNTTSPKELVSLMALLNEGKLVSMKSRDRAFDILRRTVTDTLLPSVVAPGTTVAHKTGDIGSLVGDIGVVDLPSGRRYAIALMVKRPHNDSRAQDLIRQIAAVVYEQFGGKPTLTPSPVAVPPAQLAPGVVPAQSGIAPGALPGTVPGVTPGSAPMPTAQPGAAVAPGQQVPQPALAPTAPAVQPLPEATSPEAVSDTPPESTADPASLAEPEPPAAGEAGTT